MPGESDAIVDFIGAFAVDAWLLHGDGSKPGLNLTISCVTVADDQAVAMGQLGLTRLAQHFPGALTKDLGHALRSN